MTDATAPAAPEARPAGTHPLLEASPSLRRRKARETRMKSYGIAAIALSLAMLSVMLFTIFRDGTGAFFQARLTFPVTVDAAVVDKAGTRDPAAMAKVTTIGYQKLLTSAFLAHLDAQGIPLGDVSEKEAGELISKEAAGRLREQVLSNPALVGQTIAFSAYATGRIDGYLKGRVTRETAERDSQITPAQLELADRLGAAGILTLPFNTGFLTDTDASDVRPEAAGLGIAIIGSLYMMVLVALFTVPVGVAASIYLEEFAPKNWFTDLIEVNISNLAAVPSIVFGILGLSIFINFMGLPQSSSLVGALVISLMTLPTIIIATRAAIRAVPPSIRDAALGIGASKMQTVFHHVLPLAMPGIMTGTILGLASALGETAPLLLIGMVAFVTTYPAGPLDGGIMDPATALPVQVYSWASRSDPAFIERSSGAIIVLLGFLLIMNVAAILLRRRFERRW